MDIDWYIVATIAAPIIALLCGAAINRYMESRPKLITHYGHVSGFTSHRDEEDPLHINTHSVVIRNIGRRSAKNLRVSHNYLPDYSIYPDIQYEIHELPAGGKELLFPTVVPKEEIIITYLYFPPITYNSILSTVKSDEGAAKVINVWQAPILSRPLLIFVWLLIIIGSISVLYLLFELIMYLSKNF